MRKRPFDVFNVFMRETLCPQTIGGQPGVGPTVQSLPERTLSRLPMIGKITSCPLPHELAIPPDTALPSLERGVLLC